ncbi:MAG: DNA repair protein RecN [Alphaproteobacteria bacterium]
MLSSLSIRDIVLIDRLDLAFEPGLNVLTGETGAGKSILLDALGLALGVRGDARLVRQGVAQGSVAAVFDLPPSHPVNSLLADHNLDAAESIVLRRVVSADGRSRAFINDQPAGIGLLRAVGDALVEIVGQFDDRGLLDPASHRDLLDAFGGHDPARNAVQAAWTAWRAAVDALATAEASMAKARSEEEFLRHALGELNHLAPKDGEEMALAETRSLLQHGAKISEALESASHELAGGRPVEAALRAALRPLERQAERIGDRLKPAIEALERAMAEVAEARLLIEGLSADLGADPKRLENVEERLFALRAAARKYAVPVDGLARLRDDFAAQLALIARGDEAIATAARAATETRAAFEQAAAALTALRQKAAKKLDRSIAAELAPLKLDKARFRTTLDALPEPQWGAPGVDRVAFEVATNPGAPFGPLARIASGGELARFTLALKVVLRRASPVPTLVFDELDTGIGGATAAAVADRLVRLASDVQLLVVTHSPQVAARGHQHYRVSKADDGAKGRRAATVTRVDRLDADHRREEIARMLAGATVTNEARAAAASLIAGADS